MYEINSAGEKIPPHIAVRKKHILCADIGTSSLKAALITEDGIMPAYSREAYTGPAPFCWLEAFFRAARSLAAQKPDLYAEALVISGAGPTLVPVMADGAALPPLQWFSKGEGLSGPSFFLPKVMTFKNEKPGGYKDTAMFLSCQEWLSRELGAEAVTVLPHKAYEKFYWDAEQCAASGLDIKKFPPFVPMGSRIGTAGAIRSNSALSTLLPAGTPIIAGGPDFIMALIGTAALEPGMICDRAGSSEGINLCLDESAWRFLLEKRRAGRLDPAIRLLPHALEGLFNAGYVIPKSGMLFEEYRASVGGAQAADNAQTSNSTAGDHVDDPNAVYEKLMEEIAADVKHPGRAVLSAMAANVRAGIQALRKAFEGYASAPFPPGPARLVLSGGQAKSKIWNRLKAAWTGAVLLVPEIPDGELAGDAVLGASGGESLKDRARAMVRIGERCDPATFTEK